MLYTITEYGYTPSASDVYRAVDDAVRFGFRAIELEVYGEHNLGEVEESRGVLRDYIVGRGLKVVNVAAIFPELLSTVRRPEGDVAALKSYKRLLKTRSIKNASPVHLAQTHAAQLPEQCGF